VNFVPFGELASSELFVDAIYEGKAGGQLAGEALSNLLPGVGNLGGFRASGRGAVKKLVVLYTSGEDSDWPDMLDLRTGQFIYYGEDDVLTNITPLEYKFAATR